MDFLYGILLETGLIVPQARTQRKERHELRQANLPEVQLEDSPLPFDLLDNEALSKLTSTTYKVVLQFLDG